MKRSFHEILYHALQKGGFSSLRAFYQQHSFSFSYEYLRKIFSGERVPEKKKIAELAPPLGLNVMDLQRQAAAARLEKKIRQHYQFPPATQLGHLSDKIRRYQQEGKTDAKIMGLVAQLGEKEKQQLVQYLKFLRNQCRAKRKKGER